MTARCRYCERGWPILNPISGKSRGEYLHRDLGGGMSVGWVRCERAAEVIAYEAGGDGE